MPRQKRYKTKYPGVYYIEGTSVADGKPENIFYIVYRKDGKQIEEPVGRQRQDDMSPSRASTIRASKINNQQLSNQKQRENEAAKKEAELGRWTLDRLWNDYTIGRPEIKSFKADRYLYLKYLAPAFGASIPEEIEEQTVNKLRGMLTKTKSPQTVKYVLSLLIRLVNYGRKKKRITGLRFEIEMPRVQNEKTEDLTPEQLKSLLEAIEEDTNIQAAHILKLALYTGMRRGEMFNLMWDDINWEREYILIRNPKGGVDSKIPLNDSARKLLESHPRTNSHYIFPGRGGNKRTDIIKQVNRIKERAGLPKNFRALHGLRHVYASMLASSGKVDMYTLQKLLTHKSPKMTQRYAHLRDETLKNASNLAGNIIDNMMADKDTVNGQ